MTAPAATIGGDIAGLAALGRTLVVVAPDVRQLGEGLSGRVNALVHDCAWSGDAAEVFEGVWEQDAAAIERFAECVLIAGRVIARLAVELAAAQQQLDAALARAKARGLAFGPDGRPAPASSGAAVGAAAAFAVESADILTAAQEARDAATIEISALLDALVPGAGSDTPELGLAAVSALGTILADYCRPGVGRAGELSVKLADFWRRYRAEPYELGSTAARSRATVNLTTDLNQVRAQDRLLQTELAAAERLSGYFKDGKLLATAVGDVATDLGAVQDASKLSRVLDGLPILDIAAGALATWAQATADHEKGWSWTHAIAADGGANLVGLIAGLGVDLIPYAGPFIAPIAAYGASAWTYEAFHTGHWTGHIHDDGVVSGTAEGSWEATKAAVQLDGIDLGKNLVHDVAHPVSASKEFWHSLRKLL